VQARSPAADRASDGLAIGTVQYNPIGPDIGGQLTQSVALKFDEGVRGVCYHVRNPDVKYPCPGIVVALHAGGLDEVPTGREVLKYRSGCVIGARCSLDGVGERRDWDRFRRETAATT
jgi:hypothetical protein